MKESNKLSAYLFLPLASIFAIADSLTVAMWLLYLANGELAWFAKSIFFANSCVLMVSSFASMNIATKKFHLNLQDGMSFKKIISALTSYQQTGSTEQRTRLWLRQIARIAWFVWLTSLGDNISYLKNTHAKAKKTLSTIPISLKSCTKVGLLTRCLTVRVKESQVEDLVNGELWSTQYLQTCRSSRNSSEDS